MEEMLKDRSGGVVDMDLMAVIRQDKEFLHEYYKQEIAQYGIRTYFNDSNEQLPISGNPDQLSKTIMSVRGNAVYAVARKAQKLHNGEAAEAYVPEITLHVERKNKTIKLSVRDNGIGIEEGIIGKIFDPFFTTKTTAEASGVGLYLSREIVQSHGGDIQVNSLKNEYTEFIITLPVRKS
jgi:signal transduction histidine kinase